MYFWVPFFIIPSGFITTGIIFVLSFHIFVTFISRSLYLESLPNYFSEIFDSAGAGKSNMVHVRSLNSLITISGQFTSTFSSMRIVTSHSAITFFLSTTCFGVFS